MINSISSFERRRGVGNIVVGFTARRHFPLKVLTMGQCLSYNDRDRVIGRTLKRLENKESKKMKLLLLGAGDSGKTTIFKQMRYLYGEGHRQEALFAMRKAIFRSLVDGSLMLGEKAGKIAQTKEITSAEGLAALKVIDDYREDECMELPEVLAKSIYTLWMDPGFQTVWEQRSKFDITEGYGVFAEKCKAWPEWGGPDWIPDRKDFLLGRIRTTGVVEEIFPVGESKFHLVDVGGQRNERRKWIHCFEGVTAVLFVAASSEYDQVLYENRQKNRLVEALDLFETMTNSDWFKNTTMILFLNKADLFRQKYVKRQIPLNISGNFPEAPKDFDFDSGIGWMKDMFIERNENSNKIIWVHVTTALDEDNIKVVIEAIKNTILQQALKGLSLYPSSDNLQKFTTS